MRNSIHQYAISLHMHWFYLLQPNSRTKTFRTKFKAWHTRWLN